MNKCALCIAVALLSGCREQPAVRHYTEVVMDAPAPAATAPQRGMRGDPPMPTANDSLRDRISWTVPAGWVQEGPTAMRLASFHAAAAPAEFDCSIVALAGGAGGLESNVRRWMGQIHMPASDADVRAMIAAAPERIFDFSVRQQGQPGSTPSMLAAMLDLNGTTVFIKLAGPISSIQHHKAEFLALVKSVRLK